MRSWLILILMCLMTALALADQPKLTDLVVPEVVEPGKQYKAVLELEQPAPEDGVKVLFEPTNRLYLPESVKIPAGAKQIEFEFEVPRNQNRERLFSGETTIVTIFRGKSKKWKGPRVKI